MKRYDMIKYVFSCLFIASLINSCVHQEFSFNEKDLIKQLKVKSKSLFVDIYEDDTLFYSSNQKNLAESCSYDTNGNMIEDYYMDFSGHTYKNNYYYDLKGRKVKIQTKSLHGDTVITNADFVYDEDDNLILETLKGLRDTLGHETKYMYNHNHQLIKKIAYGTIMEEYEYDSQGNVIETIENNSIEPIHHYKRLIDYDKQSRIANSTHLNSDGSVDMVESFKYDRNGRILEHRTKWDRLSLDRTLYYTYDTLGRIIHFIEYENDRKSFDSKFVYAESGLLIEKHNMDQYGKLASVYRYVYEYY